METNVSGNSAVSGWSFVPGLKRQLGPFSAAMIVMGSVIGSGIFIVPSIVASLGLSTVAYLGLWLLAGVFTSTGAAAYGVLAAVMPEPGGQYVFLREAYGRSTAFLYGWILFLIIQTGFAAAVAIAFAKFLGGVGLRIGETAIVLNIGTLSVSSAQLVGVGVIALLTTVNCFGVREGVFVQNAFTIMKVVALLILVAVSLVSPYGSWHHLIEARSSVVKVESSIAIMGLALSKVLFTYDGWNIVTFVGGEIKDPQKNIPRALVGGVVVTTCIYIAAAASYLYVLPLADIAAAPENRVALSVAAITIGTWGSIAVSIAALISTFGCVNGVLLAGSRAFYAMARDALFFPACARINPRYGSPIIALIYQGIWSTVLAVSGTYSQLLTYITFASVGFSALTVGAVFRIAAVRRSLSARAWKRLRLSAYVYIMGASVLLVYIAAADPTAAGVAVGLVLAGVPVYGILERLRIRNPRM